MKDEENTGERRPSTLRRLLPFVPGIVGIYLIVVIFVGTSERRSQSPQSPQTVCSENQVNIDGAVRQYIRDQSEPLPQAITMLDVIGPDSYLRVAPICPDGGTYELQPLSRDLDKPFVRCSLPEHPFPQ